MPLKTPQMGLTEANGGSLVSQTGGGKKTHLYALKIKNPKNEQLWRLLGRLVSCSPKPEQLECPNPSSGYNV